MEVASFGGLFRFRLREAVRNDALIAVEAAAYSIRMAVSSPDLKAFLLATPFFGGLSDTNLDLLLSMLVERRVQAGQIVIAEGDPGRSMFVVHSGELEVRKDIRASSFTRLISGQGISSAR